MLLAGVAASGHPAAPSAPSTFGGILYGVAATSASNAWAVGITGPGGRALILRWNGRAWKRVITRSAVRSSVLQAVTATSARNAWAVGEAGGIALILHWNGRTWRKVPSHAGSVSALDGVTALSARDAWAVGNDLTRNVIVHWNGRAWRR